VIGLINRYSILIILRHIEKIKSIKVNKELPNSDYGSINQTSSRDPQHEATGRSSLGTLTEDSQNFDDSDASRSNKLLEGSYNSEKIEDESSMQLEWSDFNVDMHSSVPDAGSKEFLDIAHLHG
jgi:hypothetical protein